ncbi:MerR family transcriptional regulator [Marichromatium bheemlicum]|uniref:MerR family transcriptional regulator n=1 Tax=Marichromatium bheemlicum TaxID=365339 RepID=UPI001FECB6D6|nr:MerR family transcriptional regulator [Marichromatium bheemlicum]
MTTHDEQVEEQRFRIGSVSQLTGVPAETLRVWERRYAVANPARSRSGVRLYSTADVARLTLIKRLVDRGDAIGSVAHLDLGQLRERLHQTGLLEPVPVAHPPCRLMVIGAALGERLRLEGGLPEEVVLERAFESTMAFLAEPLAACPDVLVVEQPTLHLDQLDDLQRLRAHAGGARTLVVYVFSNGATLNRLEALGMTARRAPVSTAELARSCLSLQLGAGLQASLDPELERDPPPRRYSDAELIEIAAASRTRCECPRHLVDLILALAAFERYGAECESRSSENVLLHASLYRSTARARAILEDALARTLSLLARGGCDCDKD